MSIDKRLNRLEAERQINKPTLKSATYREGEKIEYDGLTFDSEADLLAYGESKGISILPVCIVKPDNQ